MAMKRGNFFPYKPVLTEKNLTDQKGKVFIVTGGSGGIGKELAKILYQHSAKVYIAARSESKTQEAIREIKAEFGSSSGELIFLHLQLDDLTTIKRSAEEFLSRESRLDVLWNNAGVMVPPQGSKTVQGYELQLGTNNLGPFLFTYFLTPILATTVKAAPKNSVRIVWVSSSAANITAPKPAIDFSNMDYHIEEGIWVKYGRSKAGNVLHSAEFARRKADSGIISLALHPGTLMTNLQQNMSTIQFSLFKLFAYAPKTGAYTELFAGLHSSITAENNGGWVAPFGKIEAVRKDLLDPELGRRYWEWSEEQVEPYL